MARQEVEDIVESRGAVSRKELNQLHSKGEVSEHSITRYSKQNPSRQQVIVGRDIVLYSEGFEKAHKGEQIESHYASGVCISVQTVYPTICQEFCSAFHRCYRPGSDLSAVMERKGITLEPQPRPDSQNSSLGSILRQARIRGNNIRLGSSLAPYSGR